jgi:drug/metabolite transporter (DMT)-like permease
VSRSKSFEYFIIFLLTAISGSLFSVIKIALQSFTPWQLILVRFLPTVPVFAAICWYSREKFRLLNRADWAKLFAAGLFGTVIHNLALNTGQTHVGAGIAALMDALNPPAIFLLAVIFRAEHVKKYFVLGMILAFAGVAVLTLSRGGLGIDQTTATGVAILMIGPVSWGVYTILLADVIPKLGFFTAPAACVLSGAVVLLPLAPFSFPHGLPAGYAPWLCAASLAVFSTITAFVMWAWLLQRRGASRTGIIEYLNVIWGLALATLALHESLTWQMILGAGLILSGVAITRRRTIP